ncbi:MAG: type II toxin-antitoxin system RelE/ParE family toxin [Patescibacteria group bacterium]
MRIIFSPLAEKQLKKLSKIAQIGVARKVRSFSEGNFSNTQKLTGYKNLFRTRVGNYRIVFRQLSDSVYIIILGHRKEIYRLLERLLD